MKHTEQIMALADAYASQLQVCNFDDADKARDALEAAIVNQQLTVEQEPVAWATTYMGFPNQFFKEDDAEEQAKAEIERLNREYPQDKHKRAARALYTHPAPVNQQLLEQFELVLRNLDKGMSKSIQKLVARESREVLAAIAAAKGKV